MVSFLQCRGRCLFSIPVPAQVFHIRMTQTHTEPSPVMPVIQFQVCLVFSLCPFAVHHIPVKDRHCMVFTGKIRFPGEFSRCLPLFHPAFIGRYTSQCMLDGSSPEIRRHLRKTDVKIKVGMVLFRCVNQMFCCIKAFFASGIIFSSAHTCS